MANNKNRQYCRLSNLICEKKKMKKEITDEKQIKAAGSIRR